MIPRTYTIHDGEDAPLRTYKGFNLAYQPLSELERVAIIMRDGDIELYALDKGSQPKNEFLRYLAEEQEMGYATEIQIAGIYDRTKA